MASQENLPQFPDHLGLNMGNQEFSTDRALNPDAPKDRRAIRMDAPHGRGAVGSSASDKLDGYLLSEIDERIADFEDKLGDNYEAFKAGFAEYQSAANDLLKLEDRLKKIRSGEERFKTKDDREEAEQLVSQNVDQLKAIRDSDRARKGRLYHEYIELQKAGRPVAAAKFDEIRTEAEEIDRLKAANVKAIVTTVYTDLYREESEAQKGALIGYLTEEGDHVFVRALKAEILLQEQIEFVTNVRDAYGEELGRNVWARLQRDMAGLSANNIDGRFLFWNNFFPKLRTFYVLGEGDLNEKGMAGVIASVDNTFAVETIKDTRLMRQAEALSARERREVIEAMRNVYGRVVLRQIDNLFKNIEGVDAKAFGSRVEAILRYVGDALTPDDRARVDVYKKFRRNFGSYRENVVSAKSDSKPDDIMSFEEYCAFYDREVDQRTIFFDAESRSTETFGQVSTKLLTLLNSKNPPKTLDDAVRAIGLDPDRDVLGVVAKSTIRAMGYLRVDDVPERPRLGDLRQAVLLNRAIESGRTPDGHPVTQAWIEAHPGFDAMRYRNIMALNADLMGSAENGAVAINGVIFTNKYKKEWANYATRDIFLYTRNVTGRKWVTFMYKNADGTEVPYSFLSNPAILGNQLGLNGGLPDEFLGWNSENKGRALKAMSAFGIDQWKNQAVQNANFKYTKDLENLLNNKVFETVNKDVLTALWAAFSEGGYAGSDEDKLMVLLPFLEIAQRDYWKKTLSDGRREDTVYEMNLREALFGLDSSARTITNFRRGVNNPVSANARIYSDEEVLRGIADQLMGDYYEKHADGTEVISPSLQKKLDQFHSAEEREKYKRFIARRSKTRYVLLERWLSRMGYKADMMPRVIENFMIAAGIEEYIDAETGMKAVRVTKEGIDGTRPYDQRNYTIVGFRERLVGFINTELSERTDQGTVLAGDGRQKNIRLLRPDQFAKIDRIAIKVFSQDFKYPWLGNAYERDQKWWNWAPQPFWLPWYTHAMRWLPAVLDSKPLRIDKHFPQFYRFVERAIGMDSFYGPRFDIPEMINVLHDQYYWMANGLSIGAKAEELAEFDKLKAEAERETDTRERNNKLKAAYSSAGGFWQARKETGLELAHRAFSTYNVDANGRILANHEVGGATALRTITDGGFVEFDDLYRSGMVFHKDIALRRPVAYGKGVIESHVPTDRPVFDVWLDELTILEKLSETLYATHAKQVWGDVVAAWGDTHRGEVRDWIDAHPAKIAEWEHENPDQPEAVYAHAVGEAFKDLPPRIVTELIADRLIELNLEDKIENAVTHHRIIKALVGAGYIGGRTQTLLNSILGCEGRISKSWLFKLDKLEGQIAVEDKRMKMIRVQQRSAPKELQLANIEASQDAQVKKIAKETTSGLPPIISSVVGFVVEKTPGAVVVLSRVSTSALMWGYSTYEVVTTVAGGALPAAGFLHWSPIVVGGLMGARWLGFGDNGITNGWKSLQDFFERKLGRSFAIHDSGDTAVEHALDGKNPNAITSTFAKFREVSQQANGITSPKPR